MFLNKNKNQIVFNSNINTHTQKKNIKYERVNSTAMKTFLHFVESIWLYYVSVMFKRQIVK